MGIKLFVDDIRRCPDGWVPARTITEAIRSLATQNVQEVSLDHDITCVALAKMGQFALHRYHSSDETFEPVAWFISYYNTQLTNAERIKVRIHTGNYEAGRRMASILMIKEYVPKDYDEKDYIETQSKADQSSKATSTTNSSNSAKDTV